MPPPSIARSGTSSRPWAGPVGPGSSTAAASTGATSLALLAEPELDGVLVGGASLDPEAGPRLSGSDRVISFPPDSRRTFMYYLLLVLLILDCLLLAVVVLLQAGQGGGLASLGGGTTDLVVGGRQAATLLTRMTWWCGGIFLALSLVLAIMAPNQVNSATRALQEQLRQQQAPAPAPLPITPAPLGAGGSGPDSVGRRHHQSHRLQLRRRRLSNRSADAHCLSRRGDGMTDRPAFVLLEDGTWYAGTAPPLPAACLRRGGVHHRTLPDTRRPSPIPATSARSW